MNYLYQLKKLLFNPNAKNLIPIIDSIISFKKKKHFDTSSNNNTNTAFDTLENNIQYGHVDKFIAFLLFLRYTSTWNNYKAEFDITLNLITNNIFLIMDLNNKNPTFSNPLTFIINPYETDTSFLPLNFASQYNLVAVASILIELNLAYVNANDCSNMKNTALHIASKYGYLDMVKMLLQYNADVNILNKNNETALHLASQYGHLNIVKSLITESNANMVLYNKDSLAPLFLAIVHKHEEIVTYLYNSPYILMELVFFLTEKKHFNYISLNYMFFKLFKNNHDKYSSLDFFIALLLLIRQEMILNNKSHQSFELIKEFIDKDLFLKTKLLEKYPIFFEAINNPQIDFIHNKTPYPISSLHFAIQSNFLTTALILIELNMTDVNMLDPCEIFDGNTALHLAAMYGCFDIVKSLCEHNANIYALNKHNKLPLNLAIETSLFKINTARYLISLYLLSAVEENYFRQTQELITQTNDVNLRNKSQETLLHIASRKGYVEIAKLLIENNADIEAHSGQEATPLHRASVYGHTEIVELLLNNKANVNAQTKGEQLTPLHFACIHGHLGIVDLLIANQANINQVDEDNKTPLHYAYQNGHFPIIELLIENNANTQAKDLYGKIPLEYIKEQTSFNFTHHLEQRDNLNQNNTMLCYKDNVSSKNTINNSLYFS